MITLLTGENSYEIGQALGQLVATFDGASEKFDGSELEVRQLPDLLMGMSLFAEKRLVIIRSLATNKQAWEALPEWLERISDDIHLVLVESSIDKRTKTFKVFQKQAEVKEYKLWTERDSAQAERWIVDEAKQRGVQFDASAAKVLLRRSLVATERGQPVIDQWRIVHALEKLSVFDTVTPAVVEEYIDELPVDSVFSIFETALNGDREALHRLLTNLEPQEDPFKVFGLLSSQAFQLAALTSSDTPAAEVAKAIGVHPFALGKLAPFAKRLGKQQVAQVIKALTEADEALKRSKADPWVLIEQALMEVATTTSRNG